MRDNLTYYHRFYAFKKACEQADGWVVLNLKRQYNSVLPSELIAEAHDIELGEKLLTVIAGFPVRIRRTDFGYICERG